MAKKKAEEKLNLDSILFKCRDILRKARNSGSFFEKRDMMIPMMKILLRHFLTMPPLLTVHIICP